MEIFSYMHIKKSQLVNHFYLSNMFTPDFFNGLVYCYGMRYHQKISVPVPQVWSEGWQLQLGKSIKSTNLELLNVFTWCSWSCKLNPNSGCHPKIFYPSHWLIAGSSAFTKLGNKELYIAKCVFVTRIANFSMFDTKFAHFDVSERHVAIFPLISDCNGNISVTKAPKI